MPAGSRATAPTPPPPPPPGALLKRRLSSASSHSCRLLKMYALSAEARYVQVASRSKPPLAGGSDALEGRRSRAKGRGPTAEDGAALR